MESDAFGRLARFRRVLEMMWNGEGSPGLTPSALHHTGHYDGRWHMKARSKNVSVSEKYIDWDVDQGGDS